MIRPLPIVLVLVVGPGLIIGTVTVRADSGVVAVEPADLTKRPDLIGREVSVDDRVRLFQSHPGNGFDEIELKRTPVVFRLPPRLRYDHPPTAKSVRVQGVLRRDGDRWWCDVAAVEVLGDDLDRLSQAVSALPARDADRRVEWARWADRRGKDFHDERLIKRSRELETEAIRIEADRPSAGVDQWLALARRAQARGLAESESAALAHRGLRAQLKTARTVEDLNTLRGRIEEDLPRGPQRPDNPPDVSPWEAPYANDPAAAYRAAPEAVRVVLDHRLWADVVQAVFESELAADPGQGLTLAGQAATQLPDRPELAARFLERGLTAATRDLTKLRRGEVDALGKVYRDQLHQPDRAVALTRDWLAQRRKTLLRPTDAEGRVGLAASYEEMLNDRATALDLLQEAWKIDPDSKEVADAFRRHGFRKVGGDWVESARPQNVAAPPEPVVDAPGRGGRDRRMLGLTPDEVERQLGAKPQRIARSATQGQLLIQWIYVDGKNARFVNFLQTPGDRRPRSIGFYTLSVSGQDLP